MSHYIAKYAITDLEYSFDKENKITEFIEYCFDCRDRFSAKEIADRYLISLRREIKEAKINLEKLVKRKE